LQNPIDDLVPLAIEGLIDEAQKKKGS